MSILNYLPRITIPARQKAIQPRRMFGLEKAYGQNMGDYFASLVGEGVADFAPSEYGKYYFSNTWVYRAIKLRADSISAAKFRIYRELADGKEEPVEATHPVQEVFDRVNPLHTASDLWRTTETHLGIWGSSLWFFDRQGETGPEIWPLRPDRVKAIRRVGQKKLTSYLAGYEYHAAGGERIPIGLDEACWFRYINPMSDLDGASPVGPVRLTVDMGHEGIQFNRNTFRNGVSPNNLAFSIEGAMTDDEYDDFMRRLEARYKGADKAHRPFLITNGADAKTLGLSARDMEYSNALSFTLQDVARSYGIWPELLGSGTTAAFRNVGEAEASFWLSTVSSEWTFLETEVTEVLLPLFGTSATGLIAMFDPTGIPALERARAAEARLDLEAVDRGAITINEWRADQGRDPVPWGDEPPAPADPFGGLLPEDEEEPKPPPDDDEKPAKSLRSTAPALRRFNKAQHAAETKATREQLVAEHIKALTLRERSFSALMHNLFTEQLSSVLNRARLKHDDPTATFFDPEDWAEKFRKRGQPLFEDMVMSAAAMQARRFRLKPTKQAIAMGKGFNPFDRADPGFVTWIAERVRFWAGRVNEETGRLLSEEIAEARRNGESLSDLQRRIENVFGFNDAVRSELIARTESVASTTAGHLNLYSSSGVVEFKRWLTAGDERVRETHYDAQRQSPIRIDEQFEVGGSLMDGPGLGSDVSQIANCRCVLLPHFEKR